MDNMDKALYALGEMDTLAAGDSPVHRLHPLSKLAVTALYILLTVSFRKYDLAGVVPMALYPVAVFQLSGIPVRTGFRKLRAVLPLVLAVGLFNPFFDRTPLLRLGSLTVTGGVISMVTLMCKGVLCLLASFLLAATTPIDALCAALRRLRAPSLPVTLLLLTYRYVGVMVEELAVMTQAYRLRAPGQKGIHRAAWGSFLGQLLLRSMDRAEELYGSMLLRGFRGEFYYADAGRFGLRDGLWMAGCALALALLRWGDLAGLLGGLLVR